MSVDNRIADQDLGSWVPNEKTITQRTIEYVELETGEEHAILRTRDGSEFARVDFLELLPQDIYSTHSDPSVAFLPEEVSGLG